MTETNIGKLFAAGILPGILATFLLCLAVQWIVWTDPASGPRGERSTWAQRLVALKGVWAVAMLFIVVMGGIYGGVFTATEGAGIGAFGGLCFALARRALTWHTLLDSLVESGAHHGDAVRHPDRRADVRRVRQLHVDAGRPQEPRHVVQPVADHGGGGDLRDLRDPRHRHGRALDDPADGAGVLSAHRAPGLDPIWFGILIVVVVEIGLISPPVGMNLFVINALLPQVPTRTVFHGVLPFMVADVVRLAILVAFPVISLWLPSLMR